MSTALKKIIVLTLAIIVFVTGLTFYLRNNQPVIFDYFLGTLELSFSVWLLIFLVVGVLLGWLTSLPAIFKLRRLNIKLSRRVKVSEQEINNLRVMPVKDPP